MENIDHEQGYREGYIKGREYGEERAKKEIERLRKAFEKYGGHIPIIKDGSYKGICEYLKHSKNTCNCGFKKMQQVIKEE